MRGYTDDRYTFGRYFSPLEPNRPGTVERLLADNDVVLYDRQSDPQEQVNLANEPAHRELVSELSTRLEALSDAEIGSDTRALGARATPASRLAQLARRRRLADALGGADPHGPRWSVGREP